MTNARGKGGAAYNITEECERLFCEILRTVFLGERNLVEQNSLVMGTNTKKFIKNMIPERTDSTTAYGTTPPPDSQFVPEPTGLITEWIEVWDYVGGAMFRGFTGLDFKGAKALFVFFNHENVGKDLKQGLMALIELATTKSLLCTQLVVCMDRQISPTLSRNLIRDLGWVGFEPITLEQWAGVANVTSTEWLCLGMDV